MSRPPARVAARVAASVATIALTAAALPVLAGPSAGATPGLFPGNTPRPSPAVCDVTEVTPVPAIQGPGAVSPLAGLEVTTRGVVVAATEGLSGFFLQDRAGDGDPATSDGVFVYLPAANPRSAVEVAAGDVVALTGTVKEFNTLTEVDQVSALQVCGSAPLPAAAAADLPEPVDGDLERLEGMLVTVPQTLTVQQNFFLGRYGQLTLGAGGRLFQPTNQHAAGSPEARALADANARALLVLDDGSSRQNPDPIPYLGAEGTVRAGDTVHGLTGVLDFDPISSTSSVQDYRLHPTAAPQFARTNPRPPRPADVGGDLTAASFNVLNYFTTLDQRGADTTEEFTRQRDKIFAALAALDADVVGLVEIENNGDTALRDLVDGLNAHVGEDRYAAVPAPGTGTGDDAIRVALIYQPATVTPAGPSLSFPDPAFANARVPVAQTFTETATGERFSVLVNHFKSKGSCPRTDPNADPNADQGDGQGCWNADRVAQATALLDAIDRLIATAGDPDVLVLGDLNAYAEEDPIRTLEAGGLVDLLDTFAGDDAYTYVFDGQAGYLDHAMATASLLPDVTGATEWHVNADEPSVLDYNTEFKPQDLYAPTPYRSSDHDPVLVGLDPAGCRFTDDPLTATRTLLADCATDRTIGVPDGWTLDGDGHTIRAHDPAGGHFTGAVVANEGTEAHVREVTVAASGLADVCDAGTDRLRGILLDGAAGSVRDSRVLGVNQGASGCQQDLCNAGRGGGRFDPAAQDRAAQDRA